MSYRGQWRSQSKLAIAVAMAIAGATPSYAVAKARADAIIGTGADAIIGTGRAKASSTDAIIGTGKGRTRAIIGTGADAIIGTGADAIIGTGVDAIIGTGRAKASSTDAIIGTGKPAILHFGPVDSVDVKTSTVLSLGKTFKVPSAERLADLVASGRQIAVVIVGKVSGSGEITGAKMRIAPTDYVAGATRVLLVGRVTSAEAAVGQIAVGATRIDYSQITLARAPTKGDFAVVIGTQPVRDGAIVADRVVLK